MLLLRRWVRRFATNPSRQQQKNVISDQVRPNSTFANSPTLKVCEPNDLQRLARTSHHEVEVNETVFVSVCGRVFKYH